jgi:hypothetical protein
MKALRLTASADVEMAILTNEKVMKHPESRLALILLRMISNRGSGQYLSASGKLTGVSLGLGSETSARGRCGCEALVGSPRSSGAYNSVRFRAQPGVCRRQLKTEHYPPCRQLPSFRLPLTEWSRGLSAVGARGAALVHRTTEVPNEAAGE